MTREEFIKLLDDSEYSYEIEGDKIIVTYGGHVDLNSLTSLSPGVEFRNGGNVWLTSLTSLPPGVEFRNGGIVYLEALTSLSPGVEFRNGGSVILHSLTSLPPGIVFKNVGNVWLDSLIGGWFNEWNGNIEGIDSNTLLNLMIKQGVFEK